LIGMAGIMGNAGAGGGQAAGAGPKGDPRLCSVQAMAGFLNKPPWGEKPRTILTSANDGAELLYRTRHRVIGTLHHPNAQAILDSVRILGGPVDGEGGAKTLALIQKREIDLSDTILLAHLSHLLLTILRRKLQSIISLPRLKVRIPTH